MIIRRRRYSDRELRLALWLAAFEGGAFTLGAVAWVWVFAAMLGWHF